LASSFLTVGAGAALASTLAGAVAAGLASAFFSSFLAGSAAKEVKAKTDNTIKENLGIIKKLVKSINVNLKIFFIYTSYRIYQEHSLFAYIQLLQLSVVCEV
jgi:formiminotetrahydrofolate cyclodeaminase